METLGDKETALRDVLLSLANVVVAYSGGVDSTLVAAVAHEVLGERALAATAVSPSVARRELADARALARARGWNHVVLRTNEMRRHAYVRNAPDRCYWCKTELFEVLAPLAGETGAAIVTGTNADDLGDFRPGLRAARENDVRAPLAEVGLGKAEVRRLSAARGLPTSDKPASPCLASRVAYGIAVTDERLRRVEDAEEFMRGLGFRELRVRDHGDLARVEVPAARLDDAVRMAGDISKRLRELGFRYVTLDLAGFRSGSLNEALGPPAMRRPEE